jgi:hypothetical protein
MMALLDRNWKSLLNKNVVVSDGTVNICIKL